MAARLSELWDLKEPRDWVSRGNCIGVDTNIFFSDARVEEAKAICKYCPVREQCLEYVLRVEREIGHRSGVYGGTTAQERQQYRRFKSKIL